MGSSARARLAKTFAPEIKVVKLPMQKPVGARRRVSDA